MEKTKKDFNLRVHEYCVDDNTITVEGIAPNPIDLNTLAEKGRKMAGKVMLMERLDVLYIVLDSVTIHLHRNGEIMVNRVSSLEEAKKVLSNLFKDNN